MEYVTSAAFPYMPAVAIFELALSGFEIYLTYRQRKRFEPSQVLTKELATIVPEDKFVKSQLYGYDKCTFSIVSDIFSSALHTAFHFMYVYPKLWDLSLDVMVWMRPGVWTSENEIIRTFVFGIITSLLDKVISLPFDIYGTFVLEEKYGFNRTTVGTYIKDFFIGILVGLAIGTPLLPCLWYIIDKSGPLLWLYFWLFVSCFSIFLTVIYPSVIAPLFNKFTPLEEGKLRQGINEMAASINFPLSKIYVIDGSRRSSHSNAYFYGIFNKGIVLFDSLLDQCKGHDERVLAVLCHELGHWKEGHTRKGLAFGLAHMLFVSYLYGLTASNKQLFESFGYKDTPHLIGLMLFSEILTPMDSVVSLLMNWVSRRHEYQADRFAKKMGYDQALGDALTSMHIENLSNMNPDPWYSAYHNSHPTLLERLRALGVQPTPGLIEEIKEAEKRKEEKEAAEAAEEERNDQVPLVVKKDN